MVVIGAGRPHACNPDPGSGISYRLLALDPRWLLAAAQQPGQAPRFPRPVLNDPELFAAWAELILAGVLLGQTPSPAGSPAETAA